MNALYEILGQELSQPTSEAARDVTDEICRRHGPAVTAVLFYGSCLRQHTSEGVLDFYVLVDSYRAVFASRVLAVLNAVLPPNVFYLEVGCARTHPRPLKCSWMTSAMPSPRSSSSVVDRRTKPSVTINA